MGTPIPAKQWSVTDQQMLSLLQLCVLEPDDSGATWPSLLWSQSEVVGYLNDVQRDFLARTGITAAIGYLAGIANQDTYNLPQNMIDLRRIAWRQGPSGTNYVEVARVDTWEMDNGQENWPTQSAPVPSMYLTDQQPSLTVQVSPPPSDMGEAELTMTTIGTALTGGGVTFSVPDDWTPYIVWGVLAKMLSKSGQANDPDRAEYCMSRYNEGVDLARLLVEAVA